MTVMSIAEMKQKINKKVDELDEAQLQIVIDVIEKIDNVKAEIPSDIASIFEEAVARYGNVLQKLAQ